MSLRSLFSWTPNRNDASSETASGPAGLWSRLRNMLQAKAAADPIEAKELKEQAQKLSHQGLWLEALKREQFAPDILATLSMIEPPPFADFQGRIERAQELVGLCKSANLRDCAPQYVALDTPIEVARNQLLAAVASTGPELVTAAPPMGTNTRGTPESTNEIYKNRREQSGQSR